MQGVKQTLHDLSQSHSQYLVKDILCTYTWGGKWEMVYPDLELPTRDYGYSINFTKAQNSSDLDQWAYSIKNNHI